MREKFILGAEYVVLQTRLLSTKMPSEKEAFSDRVKACLDKVVVSADGGLIPDMVFGPRHPKTQSCDISMPAYGGAISLRIFGLAAWAGCIGGAFSQS